MRLRHLQFLDALRGLAASYVVAYHLVMLASADVKSPQWLSPFVHAGGSGVMLFFVVSAFSLYYTMPMRLAEPMPKLSFYMHRFFRIAPLFYVWILLTLVRDAWYFSAHHSAASIIGSMGFVFNLFPQREQGFVWASWTIGIEMIFYAMFPIIHRYIKDVWHSAALVILFILAWTAFSELIPHIYSSTNAAAVETWTFVRFLPVFAFGAIAYFVVKPILSREELPSDRGAGLFLILLSFFAYLSLLHGRLEIFFSDARYWQGLIYTGLLIGLSLNPISFLVNRLTTYLGRISYSIYLGHTTVILFLTPAYHYFYAMTGYATFGLALSYITTMLVTVAAAEVTYRYIEAPGVRLGKTVYRALVQRLPRSLAVPEEGR